MHIASKWIVTDTDGIRDASILTYSHLYQNIYSDLPLLLVASIPLSYTTEARWVGYAVFGASCFLVLLLLLLLVVVVVFFIFRSGVCFAISLHGFQIFDMVLGAKQVKESRKGKWYL